MSPSSLNNFPSVNVASGLTLVDGMMQTNARLNNQPDRGRRGPEGPRGKSADSDVEFTQSGGSGGSGIGIGIL